MLIKSLKCSFLLVFCLQFPPSNTSRDNLEKRAHLVRQSNDNLLLEPAWDRNVSLRLMGESATLTINDVDMMTVLRRRQRIIADRQAARRSPWKWTPLGICSMMWSLKWREFSEGSSVRETPRKEVGSINASCAGNCSEWNASKEYCRPSRETWPETSAYRIRAKTVELATMPTRDSSASARRAGKWVSGGVS